MFLENLEPDTSRSLVATQFPHNAILYRHEW